MSAKWLAGRVDETTIAPKVARLAFARALERWALATSDAGRKVAAQEALATLALMNGKCRPLAKAAIPTSEDAPGDVFRLAAAVAGTANDRGTQRVGDGSERSNGE